MIKTCPTETVLRRFNEGRIDDYVEIDRITEHLGLCESCIDKLEAMTPGAIVAGLRESVSNHLIADDTNKAEKDRYLKTIQDSLDQMLSKVGYSIPDHMVDQNELGENRYQLIASVGEGDFSCVFGALAEDRVLSYEAESEQMAKLVGIKIPHTHKLTSYRHSQQFFDDCQKAKSLQHPGIQPVIEFGYWDDTRLYLSKPLLQHPTLTRFAKSSPELTHDMLLLILNQLVDAIHYAHQQNVVHRHLTPDNIHVVLVEKPRTDDTAQPTHEIKTVVSDFGFVLDSRYHFDLIEPLASKNPFFSPESATLNADFVDERADIYSLGKILKLLMRLTIDSRDEDRMKKIIEKSTFARRRDRYQTVSELKAALELI